MFASSTRFRLRRDRRLSLKTHQHVTLVKRGRFMSRRGSPNTEVDAIQRVPPSVEVKHYWIETCIRSGAYHLNGGKSSRTGIDNSQKSSDNTGTESIVGLMAIMTVNERSYQPALTRIVASTCYNSPKMKAFLFTTMHRVPYIPVSRSVFGSKE